jgi:hypothetical protein
VAGILNKKQFSEQFTLGTDELMKEWGITRKEDLEGALVVELGNHDLSERKMRTWRNPSQPSPEIPTETLCAVIFLVLKTEKLQLDWLIKLIETTDLPLYRPLSPDLLMAYLRQAQIANKPIELDKIEEVVQLFFDPVDTEKTFGLERLRSEKYVGSAVIHTLISLEPVIESYIQEAEVILLEAINLYRYIPRFYHDLVKALQNGTEIQILMVHHDSPAMEMVALRSTSRSPIQEQIDRQHSTLAHIKRLKDAVPEGRLSVRLIDYMPPYGITVYKSREGIQKSVCHVRLFSFRTDTTKAPSLILSGRTQTEWFTYFLKQFELMWAAGEDWIF